MNLNSMMKRSLITVAGIACFLFAVLSFAQVQTNTVTTSGLPTHAVTVERGEIVSINGNDLFVKMADGSLRDFPNIPAGSTVNVGGKELTISQLQPGMKLERTTIHTTTPQIVTTVQTVTGKVWHVSPPNSVILTMANGENQSFKIPKGQKFTVDGNVTDAFGLKKGMTVNATKVVETPVTSVSHYREVSGTLPPSGPVLIAKEEPPPAPEGTVSASHGAGTTAPAELPKTASVLPLVGILGLLFISASFGLALLRRNMGFWN